MCSKTSLGLDEAKKIARSLGIKNLNRVVGGDCLKSDDGDGEIHVIFLRWKKSIAIRVSGPGSEKIALLLDKHVANHVNPQVQTRVSNRKKKVKVSPRDVVRETAVQQASRRLGLATSQFFNYLWRAIKPLEPADATLKS